MHGHERLNIKNNQTKKQTNIIVIKSTEEKNAGPHFSKVTLVLGRHHNLFLGLYLAN